MFTSLVPCLFPTLHGPSVLISVLPNFESTKEFLGVGTEERHTTWDRDDGGQTPTSDPGLVGVFLDLSRVQWSTTHPPVWSLTRVRGLVVSSSTFDPIYGLLKKRSDPPSPLPSS